MSQRAGSTRARRARAITLVQARHADCAEPARRLIWLNQRKMLKNGAGGGVRTHTLMEEGRGQEMQGEAV